MQPSSITINQTMIFQPSDKVNRLKNKISGNIELVKAEDLNVGDIVEVNGRRIEINHLNRRNRELGYMTRDL